jgi:predicted RNA binding protein YcfA (HicA-like mRNA interferase family)
VSTRLPTLTAQGLVKFLKKNGFQEERQRGSHLVLVRSKDNCTIVVPMHTGDSGRGLTRQILKDSGFSSEDYLRLR